MSVQLKSGREWTDKIRLDNNTPKLDKKNPFHAAALGKTIKDIMNGDFENMANLQAVAGLYNVQSDNDNGVVIGHEELTTLRDGKTEHVTSDPQMVRAYVDAGMKIVKTERKEMLSDGTLR